MKVLLFIFLVLASVLAFNNSDEYIDEINTKQNLWKAGRNFDKNTPSSVFHSLFGMKILSEDVPQNIPLMIHNIKDGEIPESFDARTHWSNCRTIKKIADQSTCASCWAVSVATTLSDRICIHSEGKLQPEISARNLLSCDHTEGSDGCFGGWPYYALVYWTKNGLVTGGSYGSKSGCQPYPFPQCDHYFEGPKHECNNWTNNTPDCVKTCDDPSIKYETDLYFGASAYQIPNDEKQIQTEILKNGPVVGGIYTYDDFLHYKSGVYIKTSKKFVYAHAVRMIGWGVENGTKYWLVANSFNEDWGDKGLFKIRRGTNECKIEQFVYGGIPK